MRSPLTKKEEQLRLIQECRSSGLTDAQWCLQHGIRLKTFYNWIYRMRQSGEFDIPATIPTPIATHPEIVKIQVEPKPTDVPAVVAQNVEQPMVAPLSPTQSGIPVMEVRIDGIELRVTNNVDPQMLVRTVQLLRGYGC